MPSRVATFRKNIASLRRVEREPGVLASDWKLWNALRDLRQTVKDAPTPEGYDAAADAVMDAANGLLRHPGPLADAVMHLECLITGAQAILALYSKRKRDLGVIDFADMIVDAERLLRHSPEVLDALLAEIDCVIVDEFLRRRHSRRQSALVRSP
jgi:ATP-dependent helicase/nuclease subunit A